MAELTLKSYRFRQEREADWLKLEGLLSRLERRSAADLSDEELLALPVLYRATLSSLSVARAISLDAALINYLESLATCAYFFVYGARQTLLERVGAFFARDWPNAAKALWRETLVALALTLLGAAAAYMLVTHDPEWFNAFVPSGLAEGRDPTASTAALRATLFDSHGGRGLSMLATFLFTHNAGIALFAFALGFAFCLPTALLVAYNGCGVGAFFALFASHGLGVEFGGWVLIHGITEIFAIVLAGAAGFRIGTAVAFPGECTRIEAASAAGRQAATLMVGVIIMLFCAGLLEGIGRQLIQQTLVRYAIAATSGLVWTAYFYLPRRAGRALADG